MPHRPSTHVCVETSFGYRTLLRLFEMKDETLCVEMVAGVHLRDGSKELKETKIEYQKFSVHPAYFDPDFCKITFEQIGKKVHERQHQESSMLEAGGTVHLVSKRFSDLRHDRYALKPSRKATTLFDFDPTTECLIGHLFVRRSDAEFEFGTDKSSLHWSHKGTQFSLDILFNKLPFFSIPTSRICRAMGPSRHGVHGIFHEDQNGQTTGLSGGDDRFGLYQVPEDCEKLLRDEFFADVSSLTKHPDQAFQLMQEIYRISGPKNGPLFGHRVYSARRTMDKLAALQRL